MGAGVVAAGGEVPELVRGFEVLAEAPDGPEKLRELVLSLAVRGRLVPQNRADAPAADLLGKRTIELEDRDAPFPLPDGWAWTTLKLLGEFSGGGTPSKSQPKFWSGSIPWVSPKDMKVRFLRDSQDHIGEAALDASPCHLIPVGALLMVVRGMILAHSFPVAINHVAVTVNQDMKAMVPFRAGLEQYLLLMFEGSRDRVLGLVEHSSHGTCKLPSERLLNLPVAMPPLAEQRRIVARVDELMALIDQFEAARTQREAERAAARDACLAKLCAAANPDEVATAWSTVASHFDTLFTSPDDIAPLRQSILQLAVRGKLVRQRASEEAASALLARIGGKTTTFPDDSLPPTPVGWATCRFGDLLSRIQAGWSPSCSDRPKEGEEYGVLKVSACSWGKFLPDENKALPARSEVPPGIEVRAGDFLISRANTVELVARSVVVGECPDKLLLSDKTLRLTPLQGLNAHFLNLANLGPDSRRHYEAEASGTSASMRNVSQEVIRALPLLLPPKLEQDRIVARVDQLMALCDQLESRLTTARDASAAFSAAASVLPPRPQESQS